MEITAFRAILASGDDEQLERILSDNYLLLFKEDYAKVLNELSRVTGMEQAEDEYLDENTPLSAWFEYTQSPVSIQLRNYTIPYTGRWYAGGPYTQLPDDSPFSPEMRKHNTSLLLHNTRFNVEDFSTAQYASLQEMANELDAILAKLMNADIHGAIMGEIGRIYSPDCEPFARF